MIAAYLAQTERVAASRDRALVYAAAKRHEHRTEIMLLIEDRRLVDGAIRKELRALRDAADHGRLGVTGPAVAICEQHDDCVEHEHIGVLCLAAKAVA